MIRRYLLYGFSVRILAWVLFSLMLLGCSSGDDWGIEMKSLA